VLILFNYFGRFSDESLFDHAKEEGTRFIEKSWCTANIMHRIDRFTTFVQSIPE